MDTDIRVQWRLDKWPIYIDEGNLWLRPCRLYGQISSCSLTSTSTGYHKFKHLKKMQMQQLQQIGLILANPKKKKNLFELLQVIVHSDINQTNLRYVQCHRRAPAVLPQERVDHIDHKLLQERWVGLRLHVRVPDYVRHPWTLRLHQFQQLLLDSWVLKPCLVKLELDRAPVDQPGGFLHVLGLQFLQGGWFRPAT